MGVIEPGATIGARPRRRTGAVLWILATLLMVASAVYQRLTGPTHPRRGSVTVAGDTLRYSLLRSGDTSEPARVVLPDPGPAVRGTLHYRRYPDDGPFTAVPLERRAAADGNGELTATLPAEPAAGKVEYWIELATPDGVARVPAADGGGDDTVVLRYKDPVPLHFLLPHVLVMFLAVLIGLRAGLGALVSPRRMRRDAWLALGGMTLGGLVLGPIVQKFAFGAYWTGFPFGSDLTDNKVLIMWLVWVAACLWLGPRRRERERPLSRPLVVAASVVMIVVYLIPHSLRGSQLDYGRLDAVEDPKDAIETGR
ncbi:MAG: hypothetical protein IPM29_28885 [Planctomycetes bacterium]|nr:hypothetical protein [Planctomycetota bacterium]